jgi:hypothetical protein
MQNKFGPGKAGCESLLFVIKGYAEGSPVRVDDKPAPMDTLRVCGKDIHEVIAHLKKWEPQFQIESIRCCGLVVLLSGSPFNE